MLHECCTNAATTRQEAGAVLISPEFSTSQMRKHDCLKAFPDWKRSKVFVSELAAVPWHARQDSQERYLTDTYGEPQMPSDLRRGGQ